MRTLPSASYRTLVGMLIVFGFITGFSIGIPFLLLGLVLALLGPVRPRSIVFWPIVVAYTGFIVTYVVIAPLGCEWDQRASYPSYVTCTNPIGIEYSGRGDAYDPSHVPALLAGVAAAAFVAWSTRSLIRRSQSATDSRESQPLGK
jgi:hypothetical protein